MAARTPLYDRHVAMGARMVEFGGYDMPLQYSGMRAEHEAVRQRAGLFDLSHMGEVWFPGETGVAAVQRLLTNDLGRVRTGGAMYSVMCDERGGIVDDVVAYRDDGGCLVVVNASTRHGDVEWMREQSGAAEAEDRSDAIALLAVQGPRALGVVQPLCDAQLESLPSFHCIEGAVARIPARISRTGYTGEDGVELYVDAADAPALWDALLDAGRDAGMLPCGLGARDTLRLEAGLRLYGQDMDRTTDPYSCALGWTVKLDKGDFIGRDALRRIRETGPPRRFIGLALSGRDIARHGQAVRLDGGDAGVVTSGTHSFTLGHAIATASVAAAAAGADEYAVDIRGTAAPARRVPLPFYRRDAGRAAATTDPPRQEGQ